LALPNDGRSYEGRYSEYVELRTSTTIARKTSTVKTASRRGDPKGESSIFAVECEQRRLLFLVVVGLGDAQSLTSC
jgi:hypothetical protein